MKNALHGLSSGFPLESKIATPAQRYVGLYYWCAYWRHWDEIIAVINGEWHVREVGTDVIRKHRTPMWADRFADAPFGTGTPVRVYMECNAPIPGPAMRGGAPVSLARRLHALGRHDFSIARYDEPYDMKARWDGERWLIIDEQSCSDVERGEYANDSYLNLR